MDEAYSMQDDLLGRAQGIPLATSASFPVIRIALNVGGFWPGEGGELSEIPVGTKPISLAFNPPYSAILRPHMDRESSDLAKSNSAIPHPFLPPFRGASSPAALAA